MTVVIRSDAGTGSNTLVALVISEKSGKKSSLVRMLVDACFIGLGWLFGAVFGEGRWFACYWSGLAPGWSSPSTAA